MWCRKLEIQPLMLQVLLLKGCYHFSLEDDTFKRSEVVMA